ncbi:MAG TPA: tetratricopeptide repeat protein, partial [Blastocatellia bacterium]|nr:tetratricopeptide repeat protein [Blastocatellia bacterium]
MMAAAVLLFLSFASVPLRAQTSVPAPVRLTEIEQLFAQGRWHEIALLAEAEPHRSADLNFYYGIALARLQRWDDAFEAFEAGHRQKPLDKRFPLEMAGVRFKQNRYAEAAEYLRLALRLDPADAYANDFLASVYLLQGNLEAALKFWNRVSKPQIEMLRLEPVPRVDAVLLDRAFAFAPASVLLLPQLQTTDSRVRGLKIFTRYRFDLEARPDGKFDAVFRARERNGWGANRWEGLLRLFRGLPFQTIHPEFFNIGRRAINFESLVRWDAQKRRFRANLSGPLSRDAKRRYQFDLDLRNENWELHRLFTDPDTSIGGLDLHKRAFTASVTSVVNGRLDWSTGVELSHRDLRDVTARAALAPELLAQGFQLKHLGQLNYELARVPEKRFSLASSASTQLGRIWSRPSHLFAKLQGLIEARWYPQASGDDFHMQASVRAGKTFGEIPFDELFILGIERDNDLRLRSHIGTRNGRKGSAPLGRNYFLSNWEIDKNIYGNGLISLKLGPFLDSGKITDPSPD